MIIENVWSLANEFVDKGHLVTMNPGAINDLAESVRQWKQDEISLHGASHTFDGMPSCISEDDPKAMVNLFLYELIANSVNYCYWYGKYNIRPNKANCGKMYALLDESFEHLNQLKEQALFSQKSALKVVINSFTKRLCKARFPLLDFRVRHLREILNQDDLLSVIEISVAREDYNVESWLEYLITAFPGYSKDLFLKRAFLFIMQMYRRCGLFAKEMDKVLIPADYQIPKMLRWMGCLEYHAELARVVDAGLLLPIGGQEECEIRANTIIACKKVAEEAGCTSEEVDTYLFRRRNWCTAPFHLVITSDY